MWALAAVGFFARPIACLARARSAAVSIGNEPSGLAAFFLAAARRCAAVYFFGAMASRVWRARRGC